MTIYTQIHTMFKHSTHVIHAGARWAPLEHARYDTTRHGTVRGGRYERVCYWTVQHEVEPRTVHYKGTDNQKVIGINFAALSFSTPLAMKKSRSRRKQHSDSVSKSGSQPATSSTPCFLRQPVTPAKFIFRWENATSPTDSCHDAF